jgi:hypothetical protein
MPVTPAYPGNTQIDIPQPSVTGPAPEPMPTGGGTGAPTPGMRTRDFPTTWDTSPSVQGPMGKMNPGHSHNVVSTEGQWARGDLPDLGWGYTFALARPRFMREPMTNIGSYNFAQG